MTNSTATTAPSHEPAHVNYSLIDRLKCFNAKERYWVVRQALGHFQPTDAFVQAAAKAAGVEPPSESAHSAIYLAMDYHLNWLHAALSGLCVPERRNSWRYDQMPENPSTTDTSRAVRQAVENSQEDVDLLLAYQVPSGEAKLTQLILIEAKCSGQFTDEQLTSKLERLGLIVKEAKPLDACGNAFDIKVVLMSPDRAAYKVDKIVEQYPGLFGGKDHPGNSQADSHLTLQLRPLDKRGFWKVRPREKPIAAITEAGAVSPGGKKPNKTSGWSLWSLSLRMRTEDNSAKD